MDGKSFVMAFLALYLNLPDTCAYTGNFLVSSSLDGVEFNKKAKDIIEAKVKACAKANLALCMVAGTDTCELLFDNPDDVFTVKNNDPVNLAAYFELLEDIPDLLT